MIQSHANCTGNTGKQHDAEAGVNRFTKTMNRRKSQTTKDSQTTQTFPLTQTETAAAFISPRSPVVTPARRQQHTVLSVFPAFYIFSLHPVHYPGTGHTAAATAASLTLGGGEKISRSPLPP